MKHTAVEWLEAIIKHCERFGTNVEQKDIDQAKEMEREQHQYTWDKCKKIIHEGFVYVKYNDLLECEKSFKNCT